MGEGCELCGVCGTWCALIYVVWVVCCGMRNVYYVLCVVCCGMCYVVVCVVCIAWWMLCVGVYVVFRV